MNKIASLFAALLMVGSLVSCSSDHDPIAPSKGKARVAFDIKADTQFNTRALNENSWKNTGNYNIEIINENNEVVAAYRADALPPAIELDNGNYTARAFCGEEHIASRNDFLCEGKTDFILNINDNKQIKVVCSPTCGKVKVNFDTKMATYFDDYYVTFSTPKMTAGTEAAWSKTDTEPWYLAVGEQGDVVTATIHLTPNELYMADTSKEGADWSEGTVVITYTLERNKAWTLNIAPDYTTSNGQMELGITIDDGTNDHHVSVIIPAEWI